MTGTILVTGASGTVGSEVATALRAAGAAYVVGLRAPAAASHPAVAFDFSAPATFDAALRGVERVFLIAPGFHEHADALLAPFIAALKPAGVKHVVYSSVSGADQNPAGAHRKIELALEATGLGLTILRPTFYMQNFLTYERDNLLLRGVIDLPTAEGKAAYVDVRDIAAVAAKVLVDGGHAGQAYDLTGDEALSHGKIAAVFSEALGFTVRFLDPSPEAYAQTLRGYGMEAWMVEASAELYGYVRQGYTAATSDNVSKLLGRPATRLEAFAADRGRAARHPRGGADGRSDARLQHQRADDSVGGGRRGALPAPERTARAHDDQQYQARRQRLRRGVGRARLREAPEGRPAAHPHRRHPRRRGPRRARPEPRDQPRERAFHAARQGALQLRPRRSPRALPPREHLVAVSARAGACFIATSWR